MRLPFWSVFILICIISCDSFSEKKRFELVSPKDSGVLFENTIVESNAQNIIIHNYLYNGAGVGVGDFNMDGQEDLFFAGNLVDNKLYLNKGEFRFEDISSDSGIEAKGQWCSGVNVFDINNDGLQDIFITTTYHESEELRKNILFIHQGLDADSIPHFKNEAEAYGLDIPSYSTHSLAFDYDKDGDLDLYIINNKLNVAKTSGLNKKNSRRNTPSHDLMLRNDGGVFVDVSEEANILEFGFGLGIALMDVNHDSWPDLYISNDFITNDILYINQKDGTFKNEIDRYLRHQSFSSMGNDVADVNNDGLEDIFTLDMLPREDARLKNMFGGVNHYFYDIMLNKNYELEYARNNFHVNRGNGRFSDIGLITDLYNTDWSWSVLMQDYDNDGLKDMFISNGFPRDITDLDFSDYHSGINVLRSVNEQLLALIPQVKIPNFFVRNEGDLKFSDVSEEWSDTTSSYSNGAVYVDLDNDGDLDIVTSNINDPAFIYENTLSSTENYLQIRLSETEEDIVSVGTKVYCYTKDTIQFQVLQPNRGYCSTSQDILHFGLGQQDLDSIVIIWPNGMKQLETELNINTLHVINYTPSSINVTESAEDLLFTEIGEQVNIQVLQHDEERFYDFDIQGLVQSLSSEKGPALAVADLDGNGTDDIVLGGNRDHPTKIAYQSEDGIFTSIDLTVTNTDVLGIVIFDINADSHLDLLLSLGSSEKNEFDVYSNQIYINDGKGNFEQKNELLDVDPSEGSSMAAAADFDKDGDIDLFIGGQSISANFPLASKPQLLINEKGIFSNKISEYFELDEKYNLVNSVIWTDINNDSWVDLITVGKWMPVRIHINEQGKRFTTKEVPKSGGLWTSIEGSDLDNDGDIDYVLGNQGLNNKLRVDSGHPVYLYAKDFDSNYSLDLITSHFIDGQYKPYHLRNDLTKQLKSLSKIYQDYQSFSTTTTEEILSTLDTTGMKTYTVHTLESSVMWNNSGSYELAPLPYTVQFSCVHGIEIDDINADGYEDIITVGNDYGTEVFSGRTDAGIGSIILNNGSKSFATMPAIQSGFYADGNTRGLASFKNASTGVQNYIVARNRDHPLIYSVDIATNNSSVQIPHDTYRLEIKDKEGNKRIKEIYKGSGYATQHSKKFFFDRTKTAEIIAISFLGETNTIYSGDSI